MCGGLWWPEKVVGSLGAKVAGICKLPNMDAGIWTLVTTEPSPQPNTLVILPVFVVVGMEPGPCMLDSIVH